MRIPSIVLSAGVVLSGCATTSASPAASPAPASTEAFTDPEVPRYKPSSSSPAPMDITTNAYGAYAAAPEAPELGDVARDFQLPLADGGTFDLATARKAGPVLVMFYRGFW